MILLRLTETFYGREDTTLTATLTNELPGILLWAIEGWKRFAAGGISTRRIAATTFSADGGFVVADLGFHARTLRNRSRLQCRFARNCSRPGKRGANPKG